jgi:hypothetical protein
LLLVGQDDTFADLAFSPIDLAGSGILQNKGIISDSLKGFLQGRNDLVRACYQYQVLGSSPPGTHPATSGVAGDQLPGHGDGVHA